MKIDRVKYKKRLANEFDLDIKVNEQDLSLPLGASRAHDGCTVGYSYTCDDKCK